MTRRVIVFGPTGNVGSIAACTAQQQGATVFLAMRDTKKPVPGISLAQESNGGFERVSADLLDPASVRTAVTQSNATAAFIYLTWQTNDGMKATLEALKAGGVEFLVFLSSFTIQGPLEKISLANRIPYMHAQVELNMQATFGPKNFVALRAGAFATNTLRWRESIASGHVDLESPGSISDLITPTDMGRVAGRILVNGQLAGQNVVYMYGPQLVTQRDAVSIIVKALGRRVETIDSQGRRTVSDLGEPHADAERVIVRLGREGGNRDWSRSVYANFEEGRENVRKYTGEDGTSFEEWLTENKAKYSVL